MTAYPAGDPGPYEVIHLGGEAAAIVPLGDLRQLQAVQRHASPELLEDADVEATLAAHREWVAAVRPASGLARGGDGRTAPRGQGMTRLPGSTARRYGKVFDEVAAKYDRYRPTYPDELVDQACHVAGIGSGDHVLEVGCGSGQLTRGLLPGACTLRHSNPARASEHWPGRTWKVLERWNL